MDILLSGSYTDFDTEKNVLLLERIISWIIQGNEIVLDSFAGSGTTAHAVLNLNKTDGGNRRFILVEMEDYAETITAERVRRVIDGYGDEKNAVPGTGGNFSFYELGEPLMYSDGNLNENIPAEKIREYVWYMETKQPMPIVDTVEHRYLLGVVHHAAYYFHYERDRITTLDTEFLGTIRTQAEQYVIYADQCALSVETLNQYGIVFKKIPRDIARL